MDRRSQEKRERMEQALEHGPATLHLDARRPGVLVPESLRQDSQLRLNFSLRYDPPDLVVGEWGVRETLSFAGSRFRVAVPWSAVFAITGSRQGAWLYPEEMPRELMEGAARGLGMTGDEIDRLRDQADGPASAPRRRRARGTRRPAEGPGLRPVPAEPSAGARRLSEVPSPGPVPDEPRVARRAKRLIEAQGPRAVPDAPPENVERIRSAEPLAELPGPPAVPGGPESTVEASPPPDPETPPNRWVGPWTVPGGPESTVEASPPPDKETLPGRRVGSRTVPGGPESTVEAPPPPDEEMLPGRRFGHLRVIK